MDIRKLQRAIVDGLEDVKGQNISVFNTEHLSSLFERVIIASGTSNRQTKALAASVRDAVKGHGFPVPRTEGEDNGEWIIVDCGAAVAHIMQPAIRDYYHLEEIWGSKPVKMKFDTEVKGLVKASVAEPAKKAMAKKAAFKPVAEEKAPARRAPAKKASLKSAIAPSATRAAERSASRTAPAKAAAGKVAAKRAATPRPVSRTAAPTTSRTAPATSRTAPAKKAAPRKTAAKKAVTRIVGVKSSSPRKAPVRS